MYLFSEKTLSFTRSTAPAVELLSEYKIPCNTYIPYKLELRNKKKIMVS